MLDDKLYTVKDLTEKLGVTRQSIYNWREKGMPYVRIGRVVRFNLDDVEKWIKEQNKEE